MGWRDTLQRAEFRGVPFFVEGHEAQLGRRVQVHEYPLRDRPYAEDLGRKSRTLSVEAFVLGPDYTATRNRLTVAAEASGAGKLVHPYLGELNVTLLSCKLRESTAEGGMAHFALEFVEAGEDIFPAQAPSTQAAVAAAADAGLLAANLAFYQRHVVAGKPAFVAQASAGILDSALVAMNSAVSLVRGASAEVAALQRDVDAARRDITTLVYTPASAGQALVASVQQLVRNVATMPRDAVSLARTLYRFGDALPEVRASTTSRRAQATNQAELVRLVRVAALGEGARAATGLAFDSYQDAIAVRDELVDGLDAVMLAADLPDSVYDALRALRSAVVRDVAVRGANLARLVAFTPAATLPALVVAQQVFADATRTDELLQRNAVRHPLFVAGQQPLEVLANG